MGILSEPWRADLFYGAGIGCLYSRIVGLQWEGSFGNGIVISPSALKSNDIVEFCVNFNTGIMTCSINENEPKNVLLSHQKIPKIVTTTISSLP